MFTKQRIEKKTAEISHETRKKITYTNTSVKQNGNYSAKVNLTVRAMSISELRQEDWSAPLHNRVARPFWLYPSQPNQEFPAQKLKQKF